MRDSATGLSQPFGIAVDAERLYVGLEGTVAPSLKNPPNGGVLAFPLGGGPPVTLEANAYPGLLAIDATRVYWSDSAAEHVQGALMSVDKTGANPHELGLSASTVVAVDDTYVYWVSMFEGFSLVKAPK